MSLQADHERDPPPLLPCAIAVSIALGAFAVFGWLLRGDWISFDAETKITAESAIYALYAALAVILQVASGVAAIAARRVMSFNMKHAPFWAKAVVVCGGLWNAYSLHNAFEQSLPEGAAWDAVAITWAVSIAVAFVEIALYWLDESLKSAIQNARAEAERIALDEARNRDRVGRGETNIETLDFLPFTDDALDAAITHHTGAKRKAEVERSRRKRLNIRVNK